MALWGGRFEKKADKLMWQFNASIGFDWRLYAADIQGSMAYARALVDAGVIDAAEGETLLGGLEAVCQELDSGSFAYQPGDEDIHTAVERRLGEIVGPVAGKLHTGRSRNDQVATDLRLYLLEQMAHLHAALESLQWAIVDKSEGHLGALMPGYTHLQQAQPILFSHWLLSFFWKFQRDRERLVDVMGRTAVCPLGSGALAGNPFGINREAMAEQLGFSGLTENSLDGVGDRDFAVEFLAWAALVQVHLSNLAEDLIIWASREFGFVQIGEEYSTGSSIMPQKRNPDSLELIRGKSGRVVGRLTGLLTTLKGLPSAYNKDLQEDKEGVFDVVDTLAMELPIAAGVIQTLQVNEARMAAVLDGALLATDLADYLVHKGVPFRECHGLVGAAVRLAEARGVELKDLALNDYQALHPAFADDVSDVFDAHRSVKARNSVGGTAPQSVRQQIERAKALLDHQNL
jgi:argininosuccinate lyase